MKLRNILFLGLSGIAVLPVLSLAAWITAEAVEREQRIVEDTHLLLARNLGGALDRYARDLRSAYELAADMAIADLDPNLMVGLLEDLNFSHLCVADSATGDVVHGLGTDTLPCPDRIPAARFATFRDLVKGEVPVFSPVMPNPDGMPTLYMLMERQPYLVAGAISTQYFVERGAAISFGKLGHAAIVDQAGNVLSHPRADWRAEMKNIASISPVAAMIAGRTGTTSFYSPAMEADMVAGFTTVPSTGWGVMIPQPAAEVQEHAGDLQNWALTIAALGVAGAGILSWFLAGMLTSGLTPIMTAADRVSRGDLKARADQSGGLVPTEIHTLTTAFNGMAEAVETGNQRLSNAVAEAEHAARAKTNFLTTITHEIRTPMNGVLGVSEMLRQTELDTEQQEMATIINASAVSLLGIVNDVLDISKIEAGQLMIEKSPVSPRELVESVFAETHPAAVAKGLEMSVDVQEDVPELINSDRVRLRQILVNLTANAIKFTESGFVRIAVRQVADPTVGARLSLSVQDTGIGVDPLVADRLFEPFIQADASTTRKYGGTGLGLSICKKLAALLGGDVTVSGVMGEGSTFRLNIPIDPVAGTAKPSLPAPSEGSPARRAASGAMNRVLVAEDHSTNLWILRRQLEDLGFEVDSFENGLTALAAYQKAEYVLVITDYLMPDVDGIGLTRAIRSEESHSDRARTPILGLTANAFRDALDRCVEAGMDIVLTKPVDKTTLGRTIDTLLSSPSTLRSARMQASPLTGAVASSSPDVGPAPAFDPGPLTAMFGASPAEGREWLDDYLGALDQKLEMLGDPDTIAERDRLMPLLHSLAGISLAAGASHLGKTAQDLHRRLRDDPTCPIDKGAVSDLIGQAAAARQAVRTYLDHSWPKA